MQATESKSLIQSKSLLAKLMAMENIIIEQRSVPTAMFDVKNRILTIPLLDDKISPELYDLFVGHEVAHALWTPMDGLLKAHEQKVSRGVTNCVEDARIERKIKVKYPGLRNSFTKAYRELMNKNFFNTEGYDINDMNFIDRANLYFKSGASLGIEFTPEERELVNEIGSTETYDDVIEVSKRICSFMKEQYEQKAKNSDHEDESEDFDFDSNDSSHYNYDEDYDSEDSDDSNNSNADSDDYDSEETEDGDSSENSQGEFEDDGDSESDSGTGEATNPSVRESSNAKKSIGSGTLNEEDIRSHTDEALKQNESMLFAANAAQINYANIPQFELDKHIVDHKYLYKKYRADSDIEVSIDRENFQKIRKDTSKIVSFLAKEFELRKNADQLKRASTAKTGDLNMSKIFSYQFNEDIFKKITVLPGGKSHGLVMFLDWSGSMNHHMANTVKQLISIVMFCKKVNIPFEVYCFSESGPQEPHRPVPKDGDLGMDAFFLLNILSSRMSAAEFTFAASVLVYISSRTHNYYYVPHWFRLGSTPFNEAIISAMDIVPAFQAKYKLQIVNTVFLTDGEANQCRTIYHLNPISKNFEHDYNSESHKRRLVVRDPLTRNEVTVRNLYDRGALTAGLIKLLKMRTNCNVVGFYLLSSRDFRREMFRWFPYNKCSDLRAKFRKEKFAIVKSAGFDEYYLMRSEGHSLDNLNEDEDFVVEEGATTRKLVNAFSKYTSNRLANRVVLNRFVGMIA
jgi:hypothetical protein